MNLMISIGKFKWKEVIIPISLIIIFGLVLRFYYFPYGIPIATDGFSNFIYAAKTVYDGNLPTGFAVTNTGWSNLLSLIFLFFDRSEPLYLMDIQRVTSIILSTITIIPAFVIFRNFVNVRWALFGSLLLVIEPRLLLLSLEGLNYSLFFFLFVLTIAFFLKKNYFSLLLSFGCIACLTLVRYEGLLLVLPLSIMYFLKFRNKQSIFKFLGMILVLTIVLLPIGMLRIQATENICLDYTYGTVCGADGFSNNILFGFEFFYRYIITGEQISESADSSYDIHRELYNKPGQPVILESLYASFSGYAKFLGLALIPFFGFFIFYNIFSRFKANQFFNFNFNFKVILFSISIASLPALYAYMRGIDEIRYVLIVIPLFCLLSILTIESVNKKIFNKRILIFLILFPIILSIVFIEYDKRDYTRDMESFKISQEIVSLTDVTNSFNNSGFIKVASLFNNWPEFPELDPDSGKIKQDFQKISIGNFDNFQQLISNSKNYGLEYVVIDDNVFFQDIRTNQNKYPYLSSVFDSTIEEYKNYFKIIRINYDLFD